mmetsp:Transcript_3634/g.13301  ORF Transcript_3634/g.13301 Transcript_3634/m.13301 type:complete len:242 (-) Transcript_3634:1221-1946(-)
MAATRSSVSNCNRAREFVTASCVMMTAASTMSREATASDSVSRGFVDGHRTNTPRGDSRKRTSASRPANSSARNALSDPHSASNRCVQRTASWTSTSSGALLTASAAARRSDCSASASAAFSSSCADGLRVAAETTACSVALSSDDEMQRSNTVIDQSRCTRPPKCSSNAACTASMRAASSSSVSAPRPRLRNWCRRSVAAATRSDSASGSVVNPSGTAALAVLAASSTPLASLAPSASSL